MSSLVDLQLGMYLTLFLVFAIGFVIIYLILASLGASLVIIVPFTIIFFIAQWCISPYLLKSFAKLRYVDEKEQLELQAMVGELAKQANLPIPKVAISPSTEPNAFVFGMTKKSATLVVHQGLLDLVDKNELRTVLAHEIGHVKHSDFIIITLVSLIPMLAWLTAQNFLFSSMVSKSSTNGTILTVLGILAFIIYFLTEIPMLYLSSERELFADSYSSEATGQPEYLASALSKITYALAGVNTTVNSAVDRSFYIADNLTSQKDLAEIEKHADEIKKLIPSMDVENLKKRAEKEVTSALQMLFFLFRTHPPTYKRIILLAQMQKPKVPANDTDRTSSQ